MNKMRYIKVAVPEKQCNLCDRYEGVTANCGFCVVFLDSNQTYESIINFKPCPQCLKATIKKEKK
jgi:hypothetical protein